MVSHSMTNFQVHVKEPSDGNKANLQVARAIILISGSDLMVIGNDERYSG